MVKVAVIGSNSFSGSHFVNHLLEETDYDLIGISRSPEYDPLFLPYKRNEKGRFQFMQGNINSELERIISTLKEEGVEYIVNFAAQGMVEQSWDDPVQWFKTNTLGIVGLTNRLRKEMPNLRKYVQVSTPEVYGSCREITEKSDLNPSTPYATSKLAGDMFIQNIAKQFGFPGVFTRTANVYGSCQQLFRIIPRSIIYIKLGKTIELHGGGEAIRSFIHIKDVCNGTLRVMEDGKPRDIYHFSSDSSQSIKSLVGKLCQKLGQDFSSATEVADERIGQDAEYIINSNKARKEFGWFPKISLDDGLQQCIDWVNNNWDIIKRQSLEYIHKE